MVPVFSAWCLHYALLPKDTELSGNEVASIVKQTNEAAWILFGEHLLIYNWKEKKLVKAVDLRKWSPHQVVIQGEQLWLISRTDGHLYGMTI